MIYIYSCSFSIISPPFLSIHFYYIIKRKNIKVKEINLNKSDFVTPTLGTFVVSNIFKDWWENFLGKIDFSYNKKPKPDLIPI